MRRATWSCARFVRIGGAALALLVLALPRAAFAQGSTEPTAIAVGAPATAELGQQVTLQARLVDGSGAALPRATVFFTGPATFLKASGDIVLARATTDQDGLALAEYTVRSTEQITIRAEFRGSERYAPSKAVAQLAVAGARQLHTEHAGVQIPGLNKPPQVGATLVALAPASGTLPILAALWPAMSGWPIAAALLVVWSLYVYVVVLIFRVAFDGGQERAGSGRRGGRPW